MKKVIYILVLIINCNSAFSQMISPEKHVWDTLERKVEMADLIFEGRVVGGRSFWLSDKSAIYTTHYLIVSKQFEGDFYSDTVKIMTLGGVIDTIGEYVTDGGLHLGVNDEGIFMCNKRIWKDPTLINEQGYSLLYGDQDIIRYSHNNEYEAKCGRLTIHNIDTGAYQLIEKIVGKNYVKRGLTSKEQKAEDKKNEKTQTRRTLDYDSSLINYQLSNYRYITRADSSPKGQFDISVWGVITPKPFVAADIYIHYDTSSLGINLVSRGIFKAALAENLSTKRYSYTVSDVAPGKIKLSVSSPDGDKPELLDTVRAYYQNKYKLFHCSIETDKRFGGFINISVQDMQGLTSYYDNETHSVRLFQKVEGFNNRLNIYSYAKR